MLQLSKWPINNSGAASVALSSGKEWRLETYGSVDQPLALSYDEFRHLPSQTKCMDHHCIDGWSYLGQTWNGVDFEVIKRETRVKDNARFVLIEGEDESQEFPIHQDLFFAFGQEGKPLSKPEGYPLRVLAPGEFGSKSIKWVRKVSFSADRVGDSRIQRYKKFGMYEFYMANIDGKNPWTVDVKTKKQFLTLLFENLAEERRAKKRAKLLEQSSVGGFQESPSPGIVKLCQLDELGENSCRKFEVRGNEILLIRSSNDIYAIEPMCTHHGTDLSKGKLNPNGHTIECPLHGATFDFRTGTCLVGNYGADGDNFPSIRTYPVKIESGYVFAQL